MINEIYLITGQMTMPLALVYLFLSLYKQIKYKDFFYSEKNIEIDYLKQRIQDQDNLIQKLTQENEEISKMILQKL